MCNVSFIDCVNEAFPVNKFMYNIFIFTVVYKGALHLRPLSKNLWRFSLHYFMLKMFFMFIYSAPYIHFHFMVTALIDKEARFLSPIYSIECLRFWQKTFGLQIFFLVSFLFQLLQAIWGLLTGRVRINGELRALLRFHMLQLRRWHYYN